MSVSKKKYIVSADEAFAGQVVINTGIKINGFIVQIYRAGILLSGYDISANKTILTIATNGATYVVTENDVINYILI